MIKSLVEGRQKPSSSSVTPRFQIDTNLIEFKVNAKFDGIRARVCTMRKNYFQADLEHFETTLTGKLAEIVIDLSLNSISVVDISDSSLLLYQKMLSLNESQEKQELIKLQVRLISPPKTNLNRVSELAKVYQKEKFFFRNYLNEEHFDLFIKANISKLRIVFLFKQLNTFMV